MEKQVIIFLKNGKTLLFQGVNEIDLTDERIAFYYFGESANQKKGGVFYFNNIAGWSASAEFFEIGDDPAS